jgi:hypothetical protein
MMDASTLDMVLQGLNNPVVSDDLPCHAPIVSKLGADPKWISETQSDARLIRITHAHTCRRRTLVYPHIPTVRIGLSKPSGDHSALPLDQYRFARYT